MGGKTVSVMTEILDQDDLMQLMGYERAGDVERKLIKQGIKPIYGRSGRFFLTYRMLEGPLNQNNTAGQPRDPSEIFD